MSAAPSKLDKHDYDPVFLHARREAVFIFFVWLAGLLWAVPYCYFNGYHFDPENFSTILGIPSWLFWGIAVPWVAADVVTTIFCFVIMKEDDLGESPEELQEASAKSKGGDEKEAAD